MFGRDPFSVFNDDPFFRQHNESMRMMRENFFGADPFATRHQNQLALRGPQERPRDHHHHDRHRRQQQQNQNHQALALANPMEDMFSHMNSMFANTNSMFGNMHQQFNSMANDPNSHSYSSSSFMSYSSNGNDPPQIYQANKSTRRAPGGVEETKRSVRDSDSGVDKIAIEQKLGERGHRYERKRNVRDGETEEHREFFNMDEEDATTFDRDWQRHTQSHRALGYDDRHRRRRHRNNGKK
eukprot:gene15156-16714_t